MLALIDADSLVYEAAYRNQHADEWDPGQFTYSASLPEALADFAGAIEKIQKAVGATETVVALSEADRSLNFRRSVWPEYKVPRGKASNMRPLLFDALRLAITEEYGAIMKHSIEADDTVGILATATHLDSLPPVAERCIVAIDKDLDTVPGNHYNWRKPEEGIYVVTPEQAHREHMYQTLIGDSTDNYPGLKGCGPKTAAKLLDAEGTTWDVIVEAYEKKGFTELDALVQARCARILHAEDWDFDKSEVILWKPQGPMMLSWDDDEGTDADV